MKIELLGTGCAKCNRMKKNLDEAVRKLGIPAEDVKRIDSLDEIMKRGVMMTPTLIVDGRIVAQGKVLSVKQLTEILGR